MTTAKVKWTQDDSLEDALQLPKGRWAGSVYGLPVEQSVEPRYVDEAVKAIKDKGIQLEAFTQAEIIVKAENLKIAFQGWVGTDFRLM